MDRKFIFALLAAAAVTVLVAQQLEDTFYVPLDDPAPFAWWPRRTVTDGARKRHETAWQRDRTSVHWRQCWSRF